jgi:cytochrome c oxidase cbb3-type subunit 4
MNMDIIRAAALIMLMIGFIGLWIWAWSNKRKPEFDQASRMPLEDDTPGVTTNNGPKE